MFNAQGTLTMTIDPNVTTDPKDERPDTAAIDYSTMTRRCSLYLDTLPLLESVDLQEALKTYLAHFDLDLRAEALSVWLMTIRDYQCLSSRNNWT